MTPPIPICAAVSTRLAGTMTAVLEATRAAMGSDMPPESAGALAERAAALAQAAGRARRRGDQRRCIDDAGEPMTPQAVVDGLMKRA